MEKDQEFVANIVKSLVDSPDKVIVDKKIDERGVLLTLTVDPEDMGKIIGRQGNTAKALRKLLAVFGAQNDSRISLQIAEPEGSERVRTSDSEEGSERVQTVADVATEGTLETPEEVEEKAEDAPVEDSTVEENPTSIL